MNVRSRDRRLRTAYVYAALLLFAVAYFLLPAAQAFAATLSISPDSGVHGTGETFSARVLVNTQGETINAADGVISFNPNELTVVSVSQSGSIFGLWAEEPAVSGGQITFSGGVPSGYSGSSGQVMTITMRSNGSGSKRLSWQSGSVLAADGRGTNVLSNMSGATYTVNAPSSSPEPEVVEYVSPPNTPSAPTIQSSTHEDPDGWYQSTTAELSWTVPSGVTQVRTSVNQNPSAVPSTVADTPISSLTASDLPEGVSYAHVQFRNEDGWGAIGRYRLAVSNSRPEGVTAALPDDADLTSPNQQLHISVSTSTAPITRALVQIDGGDHIEYELSGASSTIGLPELEPGRHSVVVEVFDAAGNSEVATLSFTISAFERPAFFDIPSEITEGVIPVFRGETRPDATVTATIRNVANDTEHEYSVDADSEGQFAVIPERSLPTGVYELTAVSVDQHGARSERSEAHRFAVQQPGYIQIGNTIVSIMSIIVPLLAMVVLLGLFGWYVIYRIRRLRRRVSRESAEAHEMLHDEFTDLRAVLDEQEQALIDSRKTKKLTKAEQALLTALREHLDSSEAAVEKEIVDVEDLVPSKTNRSSS